MTLGALEPRFWVAFCRGVGREDLIEQQFAAPGSETHASLEAIFGGRTRAEWEAFAVEVACCLEPVLDVDEALASPHVAARGMVVWLEQPGAAEPVRQLGAPVKLSRTSPDTRACRAPTRRAHRGRAARGGLRRHADRRAAAKRRGRRLAYGRRRLVSRLSEGQWFKTLNL